MTLGYILQQCRDQIVSPLEKEYFRLEKKMHSRKITDLLLRPVYRERLAVYKQLLCEQYRKMGELIEEEKRFMDDLKERYPELWEKATEQ